jgi:hypothetical protein
MQLNERSSWGTHDFKVKMLDWSAFRCSDHSKAMQNRRVAAR